MSEMVVYRNVNTKTVHRLASAGPAERWMCCGLIRGPDSPLVPEFLDTRHMGRLRYCLKCWALDINGLPLLADSEVTA